MKKYAVIDIGSNTVRMVVYAVEENDTFHALFSKKYTLGLAGYVQDGVMSQEGIHRLCGVLIECRMLLSQFEMERSFVFATASLRNIQNTREAADQIFLMTGFSVDVISGQAEAYLDYYGVMVEAPLENGLLFDIGGGIRGGRRGMSFFHALNLFLRLRGVFLFFENIHASSPHAYRPNSPMPEVWSLPNSVAEPEPRSSPRPSARAPITTLVRPPA